MPKKTQSDSDGGSIDVFVASPIGAPGTDGHARALLTLNFIIRKGLVQPRWKVMRADDDFKPDSITQAVVRRIMSMAMRKSPLVARSRSPLVAR